MLKAVRSLLLLVVLIPLTGCATNYYNVPKESYEKKVRVLGVAPIFVDAESDIRHPEKEALVGLIKDFNRRNEKELSRMLKNTGAYFTVTFIDSDADQLFTSLFSRRERRDDASIIYNKYFFKENELKDILAKNNLDALMLVVISGVTKPEKVYSSNLLSYLESDYNYLIMTAQILDSDRTILWEYPNFRRTPLSMKNMLPLQYPDFDEAAANLSEKVDVKFKTIAGITRAFTKKEKDILLREKPVGQIYYVLFDDMAGMLTPSSSWFGGGSSASEEKPKP